MIAGCPHFGVDSCVLYGKVRLSELNERGAQMSPKIETLDVTLIAPVERPEKICQLWDTLKPGEILRIINDHDPKPLHHHFEAEQQGKYEWEYEQEGPWPWIVKIKRI